MSFKWEVANELHSIRTAIDLLGEEVDKIDVAVHKRKPERTTTTDSRTLERLERIEKYLAFTEHTKQFFWEDPHMQGFYDITSGRLERIEDGIQKIESRISEIEKQLPPMPAKDAIEVPHG